MLVKNRFSDASIKLSPSDSSLPARWLTLHGTESAVSTNQSAQHLPFQRWFKFKEAFSPHFIINCVGSMRDVPKTCLDPFGGSGTTALTAQFLGIRPTTIEVNPFLADLIEAKLATYDTARLQRDYINVLKISSELQPDAGVALKDAPKTLMEPGMEGRWIFRRSVGKEILAIRQAIEQTSCSKNRLLLRTVLGTTLVGLSNVLINGKGRRYKSDWKTRQNKSSDVEFAFRQAFFTAYEDIRLYANRQCRDYTVRRGDCRTLINTVEEVDFAIFSPPYPNSFDYTDIYNLELWMLGYLKNRIDNTRLRSLTLRSHVQLFRDFSTADLESKTLKRTYRKLTGIRPRLWNANIPEMVCAYFADMQTVLRNIRRKVKKHGKVFLAIGNSQYAGIAIETQIIMSEIAASCGFRGTRCFPIRSMRSSAQQGGKRELVESVMVLT